MVDDPVVKSKLENIKEANSKALIKTVSTKPAVIKPSSMSEQANKETIKNNNLNVIKTFELTDVSGASVTKTPEFKEIIDLIESRKISGIVVSEWNRLIRMDKFKDLGFLDTFKEYKIKIYTSSQTKDLNEENIDFMSVIESMMAGKERERIKKIIHGVSWISKIYSRFFKEFTFLYLQKKSQGV